MTEVQTHNFDISITPDGIGSTVVMDGKPVEGVTDITVRAGLNGYSNVVLGVNAPASISVIGALLTNCDAAADFEPQLAGAFDFAYTHTFGDPEHDDAFEKARFVELLIEKLRENLGV